MANFLQGSEIAQGLAFKAPFPVDTREVATSVEQVLTEYPVSCRYLGMKIWIEDENKFYVFSKHTVDGVESSGLEDSDFQPFETSNSIEVDSVLSDISVNPVQNKIIKANLDLKQPKLVVDENLDSLPAQDSENPITSGAVYHALDGMRGQLNYKGFYATIDEMNAVTDAIMNDWCTVANDTDHNNQKSKYIYDGIQWVYNGQVSESNVSIDDENISNSTVHSSKKAKEDLDTKLDRTFTGTNVSNKFLYTDEDGNITLRELETEGTAETTTYTNADYPDYTNVDLALDALFAKVYYVKPACSLSANPSGGTFEMGTTISAPITFTWTINKDITSQTLTGCTLADASVRTATYNTNVTADKTFTLSVSDGENSATSSVSYKFLNKIHWGNAIEPTTYDGTFILGLTNSKLASSNKGSFSFNAGSGEYCYFATPTSMKVASAWVNGFQADLEEVTTVSHTNASGYTTNYTITRFANAGLGSFSADVK